MDESLYDRRDAQQQCAAYVGFTFLASWGIWAALWTPGVNRWPYVAGAIMLIGWWAPAVVAGLSRVLFRRRRGPEEEPLETEPAPLRDYLFATLLVALCAGAAFGFAIAVGVCQRQWTWAQTGWPLELGGPAAYMAIEVYDFINNVSMWVQTAVVEFIYWLWLLIAISGAEIGWRGAFLPLLTRAGYRPWLASLITGAIYGVWLWPLVWSGNLTGFYPGAPVWGTFVGVLFGVGWGFLLGWLYFRNQRLGPVVTAVAWVGWIAMVLPLVASPFEMLLYADPRSASGSLLAGGVAALLWRFRTPPEVPRLVVPETSTSGE